MKLLHPLSRCEFMACVKHATASRVLRFAFYANWYGSFGRVVMEPISFNTSDSCDSCGAPGVWKYACANGQLEGSKLRIALI